MTASDTNILQPDLDAVLEQSAPLWEEMRRERIFITGGTGFIGTWLLESFLHANRRLNLKAQAMVLTRDPRAFTKRAPHLVGKSIVLRRGSVLNFHPPPGKFAAVIHAAANLAARRDEAVTRPLEAWKILVRGTEHVLEAAAKMDARKFLFTSSGAVYGTQPPKLKRVPETYRGAPISGEADFVYGEGKRAAEMLCMLYGTACGIESKIARLFACVGPWQPLDSYFAIGNFIRDVLNGRLPEITGDGRPCRSYLYAADVGVWLWTILFRGVPNEPYNVGSEREITILEAAKLVARCGGFDGELINAPLSKRNLRSQPPPRYVPATAKARTALGLSESVTLEEAVVRTLEWHRRLS